jgi:small-conductance mechanosensitive channel
MQGILYEEPSILQFFFVTCLLGGWAAWMTGRSCAQTWRPYVALILYLLLLGIAVRFIHHALFEGTMFTLQYYVVDTIILLIIGTLGYRYTRANQMVTQYSWLYERASLVSWKPKA